MDKNLRPCIAELLGTFVLCFLGAGAICMDAVMRGSGDPATMAMAPGLLGIALAHGIAYALAVTATMHVSGGHVNPAVSICMWVLGRIDTPQMISYVVSQLVGAVIAGGFILIIFQKSNALSVGYGTPHVGIAKFTQTEANTMWMACLIELILTFILVFAIFGTIVDRRAPILGGFGVGLALLCDILVGGPYTGAAVNPARYFGFAIWEAGATSDATRLKDFYVYIIGPVLGAILAGWIYTNYVLSPEQKEPAAK